MRTKGTGPRFLIFLFFFLFLEFPPAEIEDEEQNHRRGGDDADDAGKREPGVGAGVTQAERPRNLAP